MRGGQKGRHQKVIATNESKFRKSMFSEVPNPASDQPLPRVPCANPLDAEIAMAEGLARADRAASTRAIYHADFGRFTAWCAQRSLSALPAEPRAVAAYIAAEAARGLRAVSIGRHLAAIAYAHRAAGHASPTSHHRVRATVRGLRRSEPAKASRRKTPLMPAQVAAMAPTGDRPADIRNRALLLLGFAGAFRRSELVALDVEDLTELPEGLRVRVTRSKTDQEAAGEVIAIPRGTQICPVAAVKTWLESAGIASGAVFRPVTAIGKVRNRRLSGRSVADIVKAHAALIKLDVTTYSAHSLRSGFLTAAAGQGAGVFKLMDQSRHKSVETLREYVRDANLFADHAGKTLL